MKGLRDGSVTTLRRGERAPSVARVQTTARTQQDTEFYARNVRLDTGEWVDRALFEGLEPAQQSYLRSVGIEQFNARNERIRAASDRLKEYMKDGQIDTVAALEAGKEDDLKLLGLSKQEIGQARNFLQSNLKVNGEWINKTQLASLPAADQARIQAVGVSGWQAEIEAASGAFAANNVKVGQDEKGQDLYLTKQEYQDIGPEARARIQEVGIQGYAKEVEDENARIEEYNKTVELTNIALEGVQRRMADYSSPEGGYYYLEALGNKAVTADELVKTGFITESEKAATEAEATQLVKVQTALDKIKTYQDAQGSYDLQKLYENKPISAGDMVLLFGAQAGDSKEVAEQKKAALLAASKGAEKKLKARNRSGWSKAASISKTVLDWTVPGYGTIRHWDEMPTWNKALSIATDVAMLIPVFGAAGKGARAVTVAVKGGTRAAQISRMKGAAKAVIGISIKSTGKGIAGKSLEVGELWRSIAWAPELMGEGLKLAKPITVGVGKTAKTYKGVEAALIRSKGVGSSMIGRTKAMFSPLETLVNPTGKLAESTVTTAYHTIKVPLKLFASPDEALRARNTLMREAAKPGNHLRIETRDYIVEFRRGRLMRKLGGYVSGTPQGEEFLTGTIVRWKPQKAWEQQGLFFSHEPLGRFVESTSGGKGGSLPSWVITSERLTQGTKAYRGAFEAESLMKPTRIVKKPAQVLYTRLGDTGTRVVIMLPTKLSKADRLKFNALSWIDAIENIYKPSVTVATKSGKPLTSKQAKELAEILTDVDPEIGRNLTALASDPATRREMEAAPDVFRVRVSNVNGTPRADIERVQRRQGESPRQTLRRAETEVRSSLTRIQNVLRRESARAGSERAPVRVEVARARVPVPVARVPRVRTPSPRIPSPRISAPRIPAPRLPSPRVPSPRVPTVRIRTGQPRAPYIRWLPTFKGTQKEARALIKASVTFKMGELSGKGVWWILYPPTYGANAGPGVGEGKAVWVHENPPTGVRVESGLQSAYKTIQTIGGQAPGAIPGQVGFSRYNISQGRAIKFKPRLSR